MLLKDSEAESLITIEHNIQTDKSVKMALNMEKLLVRNE